MASSIFTGAAAIGGAALIVFTVVDRPRGDQQTSPQGPPVFRAGIDLIQLDVSVLDKDRRPVRGLTAADFTVLEDGKPQKIEAFSEINLPDPVKPPAKWMRRTSSDVTTNDLHESRIVVIVLDDAVLPGNPGINKSVKSIGHQIVEKLGPSDLATVIYTLANRGKAQDFTSDHAKLLAAVDRFTPGFATYGIDGDDYLYYQYSENVIHDAAEFLIALPNRRKALIYVSSGVPLDPGALAPALIGSGAPVGAREEMVRLNEDLRELIKRAQQANVAIYPIDASGLDGVYNYVLNKLLAQGSPYLPADSAATTARRLSLNFLLETADNTGGRATVNTNDFTEGITQIFRENGSYYLLGYRQTNPKAPNSYSRLDVRVDRKDVEVRSRHISYTPKVDKALSRAPAVTRAMAGLLPDPETPLRATAAPFAHHGGYAKGEAKDEATVAIVLGVRVTAPTIRVTEHVNMLTRAFDMEGGDRGSQAQKADVTLRPVTGAGDLDAGRYEVLSQISLRPGRYQLRLAMDNESRDLGGSVFVDVDVPDFGKEPLSLSGVVLEAKPAPATAPLDALKNVMPVIPTTAREFAVGDQVGSFLQVYQGGKSPLMPVTFTTTILDVHDAGVFTSTTVLQPDRFTAERSASMSFRLPLATLEPGPHLLVFEATAGKAAATREVVFSVR